MHARTHARTKSDARVRTRAHTQIHMCADTHTCALSGVDLILGCNGLLWVQPHIDLAPSIPDQGGAGTGASKCEAGSAAAARPACTREQIEVVARVGNAIRALAHSYLAIYPATIMDTYEVRRVGASATHADCLQLLAAGA